MAFEANDRAMVDAQQQPSITINDVMDCENINAKAHIAGKPNPAWDQLNQSQREKNLTPDDQGFYTVERGDTMFTIAERSLKMQGVDKPGFKATQEEMNRIIEFNHETGIHCNPNRLSVGTRLALPLYHARVAEASSNEDQPLEPTDGEDIAGEPRERAPEVVLDVSDESPAILAHDAFTETSGQPAEGANEAPVADKPAKFYGLNLGLFKLGVTSDGSLNVGANVGIARGDVKVGLNNRVEAGVGIDQLGARGGAGFGINKHGLHADAGASANVAKVIDTGANAGVQVGPRSGLFGNLRGKVGPAFTDAETTFNMRSDGVNFNAGGAAGINKVIQGHADTRLGLNDDSNVGAHAGIGIGPVDLSVGTDVTSNGNSVIRPGVHLDASDKNEQSRLEVAAQVGPKLDASVGVGANHAYLDTGETSGGDASLGIGFSGVGAKSNEWKNDETRAKSFGLGKDF